jgi:magnesium chelatase family protein
MLARRLPSILPPLTAEELLEVSMVHSMAGALSGGQSGRARPFRAPHHSASMAALVGGGTKPRPGEAALAHHGVLFLDELPEFSPQVLDALRQPLEAGETIIARTNHRITYPSRIQLVAAMNPCRCGRANEPGFACSQGRNCADRYQSRVSGPLLDRIDMQIEVPTVTAADLIMPSTSERSEGVLARVIAAREIQTQRYAALGQKGVHTNSNCAGPQLEEIAAPDKAGMALLHEAAVTLKLSARGYHRTLRVARTLADLDGVQQVARIHIAEALSYRGETLKRQIAA